jgi:hypothetical protein
MLLALKRRVPQEGARIDSPVAPPLAAATGDFSNKQDASLPVFSRYLTPGFISRPGRVTYSRYPRIQNLLSNPSVIESPNRRETLSGSRRGVDPPTQIDQATVINVQNPTIPIFSRYQVTVGTVTRPAPLTFSRYLYPVALLPIRDGRLTLGILLGVAKAPPRPEREAASEAAPPVILPVGPITDISASDVGSGVESIDILALVDAVEVGSGVESSPNITAIVGTSDNGAGLETFNVTGDIPVSDSGSGSESEGILALVPASDSGSGVESLAILALVPASDAGSGVESESILAVVGTSDNGAGLEGFNVTGDVPVTDAGSGVESENILAFVSASDSGSGAESAPAITAIVGTSDNGAGLEDFNVTGDIPVTDSGSGTESEDILATVPAADAGSGVESESILALVSASDAGAGIESESIFAIVGTSDNGAGTDGFNIAGDIPVSDSGSGFEQAIQINDFSTIFDEGSGAEELEIHVDDSVVDGGVGVEGEVGVLALVSAADSGSGGEGEIGVLVEVFVSDSGVGVEDIVIVKIPAPSSPSGGGFSSWGGGGYKPHEPGMKRRRRQPQGNPSRLGSFVSKVAEDLTSTITEGMKKNSHADAMEALTKGTSPDKVKEGMIRALRKRIAALEENIRKLKGLHTENISELQHALVDQLGETEELEGVILQLEGDLQVEMVRTAAYQAARQRATQMMAEYPVDPPANGSSKMVVGALAYLAVEFLVPDRMGALKDVGRAVAAGVAISGLVDYLHS